MGNWNHLLAKAPIHAARRKREGEGKEKQRNEKRKKMEGKGVPVRRCCETVQGTGCYREQSWGAEALSVGVDDRERRDSSLLVDGSGAVWRGGGKGRVWA